MEEAAGDFSDLLGQAPLREPVDPIVMNAVAQPVTDPAAIRDALAQQLTSPVRWSESMAWMTSRGIEACVEIGPKNVLTSLLRRIDRSVERITTADALERWAQSLGPAG